MSRRKTPYWLLHGCIGKGKFIHLKGRAAWDCVPKFYIFKDGKRSYITHEGFLDNVWMSLPRTETASTRPRLS